MPVSDSWPSDQREKSLPCEVPGLQLLALVVPENTQMGLWLGLVSDVLAVTWDSLELEVALSFPSAKSPAMPPPVFTGDSVLQTHGSCAEVRGTGWGWGRGLWTLGISSGKPFCLQLRCLTHPSALGSSP
jgi:hypothetical protein